MRRLRRADLSCPLLRMRRAAERCAVHVRDWYGSSAYRLHCRRIREHYDRTYYLLDMAHKAGAKVRQLRDGPVVAKTFFWLDSPTEMFKTFIEANMRDGFTGSQAVSKDPTHDNGMPVEFQNYISRLFEDELDYVVTEWRFWIGVTHPNTINNTAPKFAKGFPHAH